jgi:hypothetical protein
MEAAYGFINDLDRSIQSKDSRPMIVVMPQGDMGYWVNWVDGGPRWGDCMAHSPSLHLDDGTFSAIYGMGADSAQREPIDLAVTAPDIESSKIWIDAGEEDPWLDRDEVLDDNLSARGFAHNWNVLPGGHDGDNWMQNIPAYLRFYDSVLNWDTSTGG